jgi:hypothetical protein
MAFSQNNEATVEQYGSNTSIVNQTGELNEATVQMGELGDPVTNKDTGSWRYGAFIDQVGTGNEAEIKIWKGDGTYGSFGGSSNGARIQQDGDGNQAFQDISNSQVKTTNFERMGAHIKQLGDNNFAQQEVFRSFGTHGSGGILIDQDGIGNQARQYVIGGRANVTEVFQTGNNNTYTGFQSSSIADMLDADWQFVPAGENYAQFQRGEYSELRLNITGDDNTTAQYQEGTVWGEAYNVADIVIFGDENQAAQAQLGTSNTSNIDIQGDLNEAGSQQIGLGHSANILQVGNSNFSTVVQQNLP